MRVYRRKYKDMRGKIRYACWYYKFTIDGEVYKDTVREARTTRQAAEAERRARQAKYDGVYGPKGKRQLLSAFVREVYLLHVEQHNRDFYHYQVHAGILCEYFRGRTLGQISPLAVESFKRDRLKTPVKGDRPRKPRAVNAELTTLSAVCSRAVRLGLLRENPCRRVEWFKAEDGPSVRLPAEDEGALLESAESGPPFLAPMIRLALWTSFRQGELIALAKPAVDFGRNRVFVVNSKWRKDGRKTEGNPMSPQVRELLAELCQRAEGDLLFTDEQGRRLKRASVDHFFRKACRGAGSQASASTTYATKTVRVSATPT